MRGNESAQMVVPAMSNRPRTIALRMPSTHPASGKPIICINTLGQGGGNYGAQAPCGPAHHFAACQQKLLCTMLN